jgi:sigma-B regulation protein RsbU (phosphoserine phosphatase)
VLAERQHRIEAVFDELADALHDDLARTERFISAIGVALAPGGRRLEVVNAGHCPALVHRARTGRIEEVHSENPILGLVPGVRHVATELTLEVGDVVLLYTDGVTEAANAAGEMFGEGRLRDVLAAAAGAGAGQVLERVFAAVERFTGEPRRADDISALVIRAVNGGGT